MHGLVLKAHEEYPSESSTQAPLSRVNLVVDRHDSSPDSIPEGKNLVERRPVLILCRDLGMRVNRSRIVHAGIDPSLKDVLQAGDDRVSFSHRRSGRVGEMRAHLEVLGLRVRFLEEAREEDIGEGWDVA